MEVVPAEDQRARFDVVRAQMTAPDSEGDELLARTGLTRSERSLRASAAVNERWARQPNRLAATQKMRDAAFEYFENQVDPERIYSPEIRRMLAKNAQRSHLQRIALKREKNRRLARGGDDK
jgi:hypothetical protein